MTPKELARLVELGLVRPVRAKVLKGKVGQGVIEYELTAEGRALAKQTGAAKYAALKDGQRRYQAREARAFERQIADKRMRINLLKKRVQ